MITLCDFCGERFDPTHVIIFPSSPRTEDGIYCSDDCEADDAEALGEWIDEDPPEIPDADLDEYADHFGDFVEELDPLED